MKRPLSLSYHVVFIFFGKSLRFVKPFFGYWNFGSCINEMI